jgi:hypothetical protein
LATFGFQPALRYNLGMREQSPVRQSNRVDGTTVCPLRGLAGTRLAHWSVRVAFFVISLALLSGCGLLANRSGQVALDLTAFLPSEWQPVGTLREINIDDDAAVEYLMLYRYDQVNGSGPIGALILDPQAETIVSDSGERVVGRPASFPNPYAILPNYWRGSGQGFIAAPGQENQITVQAVTYAGATIGDLLPQPDTLILRGGNQYLTFVWWRNIVDGYGVTQLYAPGGFEEVDWTAWQRAPGPILSIVATTPRYDRSLFCHKTRYTLADPTAAENDVYRQPIRYLPTDLGIFFCSGPPTHPFYPEGVVLAFLRYPERRQAMLAPSLQTDADEQGRLLERSGVEHLVRVDEVLGYPEIAVTAQAVEPKTTVCAQVVVNPAGEFLEEHRWLLFTLQHEPPHLEPPTPDRLYIASVDVIPTPATGVNLRCDQLISVP